MEHPGAARRLIRRLAEWEEMRASFRWQLPARLNIAERISESWARREPGREAIVEIDAEGRRRVWSHAALRDASARLASALAALGVERGDRVGVALPQGAAAMIADLATWRLGAVAVPLFTLFGEDALAFRLADSGARALVTDRAGLDKAMAIRDRLPDLAEIIVAGSDPVPGPARAMQALIDASRPQPAPADTAAEEPAVLIYTSGTTGPPKGALHAHRFLLGHLPSIELHHARFPQPGDRGWTPADWAWIGGLMDMAVPCLYYGVPVIAHRMRKFDPEAAWRLIEGEGIRNLFLPPTAVKLMRAAPVPRGVAVRSISSGGESLGAELLDWGREALGVAISEIYGQTECNLVVTSAPEFMPVRPGSMGRPVPGHDVAIIDHEGRELAEGQTGEIAVRRGTPVMFLGYWGRPEQTAARFTGEWMRTGDLGRRDADGYLWFLSRDDDVITSAGYRIGPSEIEAALMRHPQVVMAAAVGVPDPLRTEVVKAFVVLRDGQALTDGLIEELRRLVAERVSPHVVPRMWEQRPSLPMTATGKVMRRALRASAETGDGAGAGTATDGGGVTPR